MPLASVLQAIDGSARSARCSSRDRETSSLACCILFDAFFPRRACACMCFFPRVTFLRNIRGLKGGPLGYSVSRFVVRAYGRVATACCHEVARAIIAPFSRARTIESFSRARCCRLRVFQVSPRARSAAQKNPKNPAPRRRCSGSRGRGTRRAPRSRCPPSPSPRGAPWRPSGSAYR